MYVSPRGVVRFFRFLLHWIGHEAAVIFLARWAPVEAKQSAVFAITCAKFGNIPVFLFSKFVGGYFLLLDSEMRHQVKLNESETVVVRFVIELSPIRLELGS